MYKSVQKDFPSFSDAVVCILGSYNVSKMIFQWFKSNQKWYLQTEMVWSNWF